MRHDVFQTDPVPLEEPALHDPRENGDRPERAATAGGAADLVLQDAFDRLWAGRWRILVTAAACFLAGTLFLLLSQDEYRSEATLMPEKQNEGAASSLSLGMLSQFSGLLGANASNLLRSGNSLPVELYPQILESTPVQLALLKERVRLAGRDSTLTLFAYLDQVHAASVKGALSNVLSSPPERQVALHADPTPAGESEIVQLSAREQMVVEDLRRRIDSNFNLRTGVLDLSVEMPDPNVAAQIAAAAIEHLTAYITSYRVQKLHQDLTFIEERHREAKQRFDEALTQLARFRDRNQHLARDLARTEEQRLEAEYNLAFNLYNSLASRLEEARIRVQEETPVFQVLQPVTVPLQKSYPPTLLTLALCLLLGLLAGTGYVLFKPDLQRFASRFRRPPAQEARSRRAEAADQR